MPDLLTAAQEHVIAWAPLAAHPQVAAIRQVFISPEMGGGTPSLCVAHTYFPGAVSLEQAHLHPRTTSTGLVRSNNATEDNLWSYLVQV